MISRGKIMYTLGAIRIGCMPDAPVLCDDDVEAIRDLIGPHSVDDDGRIVDIECASWVMCALENILGGRS